MSYSDLDKRLNKYPVDFPIFDIDKIVFTYLQFFSSSILNSSLIVGLKKPSNRI